MPPNNPRDVAALSSTAPQFSKYIQTSIASRLSKPRVMISAEFSCVVTHFSSKLVVLALDLDVKQSLVEIASSSSLLEFLDLAILKLASSLIFQLFSTDLHASLFSLLNLKPGLESGLHSYANVRGLAGFIGISSKFWW